MGGHRNIEYAFWANEQALGSAALLLLGGFIGVLPYQGYDETPTYFGYYWAGVFSIIVCFIVLVLEYPRGKRKKGSNVLRRFQEHPAKLVTLLGPVTRNYYSRFVMYFILGIPCCCLITTLLGGVGLVFASLVYFVSAIKGEQWIAPNATESKQEGGAKYIAEAPKNPPPRRPEGAKERGHAPSNAS